MYVDDADYSKRVHDAGWKILYFADTSVVHVQGERRESTSDGIQRGHIRACGTS
jgi:GT2 family glycosyltransferase